MLSTSLNERETLLVFMVHTGIPYSLIKLSDRLNFRFNHEFRNSKLSL